MMEAVKERPSKTKRRAEPPPSSLSVSREPSRPSTSVDSHQMQVLVKRLENLEVLQDDLLAKPKVQSEKEVETIPTAEADAALVLDDPVQDKLSEEHETTEAPETAEAARESTPATESLADFENVQIDREQETAPENVVFEPAIMESAVKESKEEAKPSGVVEITDNVELSSKAQLYPEINRLRLQELLADAQAIRQPQDVVRVQESAPPIGLSLEPLTEMQLRSFYYNAELEMVDDFVDEFLEGTLRPAPGDEFFALLQSYLESCRRVEQLHLDAQDLSQRWDSARRNVWLMENVVLKEQGYCGEGRLAAGAYTIQRAKFQQNCFEELKNLAQKRRHLRIVQLAFASHQSKTAELQCKHYIYSALQNYRAATGVSALSPSFIRFDEPPAALGAVRRSIHSCITVLFHFLRQPVIESVFVNSCRSWLNDLCGTLLRYSFTEDHLFLLSHVLRCPNGVGVWASGFIQPVCHLNSTADGDRAVDHFLSMLCICLNPIRRREDYLKSFISPEVVNTWTIVDADGEEERELVAISEADLLGLLNQFSFDQLFSAWFQNMQQSELTEPKILRLFAFELTIMRILFDGIRAYNGLQYKQVCKQLAYVMRQSVQYVAEFWQYFKSHQTDLLVCERLQLEFDRLVLYTVYYGVSSKGLGVWQFLADLPYGDVSTDFQWRIVDLLLSPGSNGASPRDVFGKQAAAINEEMKDAKVLELRLHDLDQMDATYLLTALSNMACSAQDVALIQTLTTILFTACFERPSTREVHHKAGRELLRAIVERHTWLFSYILVLTESRMDYMGGYALEMYDNLPRHMWSLTETDWMTLRQWLFQPLASLRNTLAQRVLLACNWGFISDSKRLFLAAFLHRQVAAAVVKAYDDLCPVQAGLISGSIKKASKMASSVSGQLSGEQQFMEFCWQLLLRLKLHPFDYDISDDSDLSEGDTDDGGDLQDRAKKGNPFAAFVAFQMTVRSAESLIQSGLALIEQLLNNYFVKPAIVCVVYGLRLLADKETFQNDERWYRCFDSVVHVDDTYYHYAKTLVTGNYGGENLANFASMLSEAILALTAKRQSDAARFVNYVVRLCCCTNSKPWNADRATLYLLDRLIESSFLNDPTLKDVIEILRIAYETTILAQHRETKGGMLSLFRGGKPVPPLLTPASFHDYPWVAFCAIKGEEITFQAFYRNFVLEIMRHPAQSLDHNIRSASSKSNVQLTVDRLAPFLYLELGCSIDAGHPLLPLVCQECCLVLFERARLPEEPSLPPTCVGAIYLRNESFLNKMVAMKKGLQSFLSQQKPDPAGRQSGDFRIEFFGAVCSWLSDSRLFTPIQSALSLGLPLPHALESVLNGNHTPWLEYADFAAIRSTVEKRSKDWFKCRYGDGPTEAHGQRQPVQISALQRLFERLKNVDRHNLVPPPAVGSVDAVFYTPDVNSLQDENQISGIIDTLLQNFYAAASDFSDMQKSVLSLDELFFEQLKKLYIEISVQVTVTIKCHRSCASPNNMKVMTKASKLLDNVQNSLDQNRTSWSDTIDNISALVAYNIPHHCVCLYAIIRQLTGVYSDWHLPPEVRSRLRRTGVKLFYKFVASYNDRIAEFPPTKALFQATIERLGVAFILRNPDEIENLLELIKQKHALFSLLIALFDSDCASNEAFSRMYSSMCEWIEEDGSLTAGHLVECLKKMNVRSALQRFSNSEISQLNRKVLAGCCAADADAVLTVLRGHWADSFVAGLPSGFRICLEWVLNACEGGSLSPLLLDDIVSALNSKHASEDTHFGPAVYMEIVSYMSEYFSSKKAKCEECDKFGIYHCWEKYAMKLWPLLSFCFVRSVLNPEVYSSSAEGLRQCFSSLTRLFRPWIEPGSTGRETHSPWSLAVDLTADAFVQAFVDCLCYIHRLYSGDAEGAESICSLALEWYVGKICPSIDHLGGYVWRSYHSHLLRLPWQTCRPTIMSMEALKQMIRDNSPSAPFATSLIVRLPWTQFLRSIAAMPNTVRSTVSNLLLNIVVRCAGNEKNYADCKASFPELLHALCSLDWSYVDVPAVAEANEYILRDYDCKCILHAEDQRSADGAILRLLAVVSFFTGSPPSNLSIDARDSVVQKRVLFIRLLIALAVRCSRLPNIPSSAVTQFFVGLIGRIDSLLLLKFDVNHQDNSAIQLISEALLFLNQANKPLFEECVTAIGNWLSEHPDSVLCLSLMQAYGRVAVNSSAWLAIGEKCIAAHFMRYTPPPTWREVLERFSYKDNWAPTIKAECLQKGHFLSLYAFWTTKLRSRKELTEETVILRNGIETLQLFSEKQLPETQSIILIGLAVNLLVRQVLFGASGSSVVALTRELASCLQNAAEGKTGILSSLGLSKKITYSPRFQLLCMLISNYLVQQVIDDGNIRLRQASVVTNSRMQWVQSLRSQKQYSSFTGAIDVANTFFIDSYMHIEHAVKLYAKVASMLFPERYVIDQCTTYANS